ncbi:MAG: cell division protein FtsQ/DivIB, partial [Solirubrobacteraceae bacterium]
MRRLPRPGLRALAAVLALLALAGGAWMWLRNSSLVAVQRVSIVGLSGREAHQIRSALTLAARNMTTLDVKMSALRTAVAPYPVVKQLHVSTGFPHRMRIDVVEEVPVATISAAGIRVPVASDGAILRGVSGPASLPTISLPVSPGGTHATGSTLQVVRLLAAAPYQLLYKVSQASDSGARGLEAQLRNGPKVYFGSGDHLGAKWAAAAAVLADSGSAGADYIDVTVPSRPAAGAGSDSASSPQSASSQGATAATLSA